MYVANKQDIIKTDLHIFSKYFTFLFNDTIKKRSILIIWLTYLIFTFSFVFIVPFLAHLNILDIWANTLFVFCQSLLNVIIAIFTGVLAINIIKFPNKNTTSLIVSAKPISRFKMVFCRFLLFFIICIIVNLSASVITFLSLLIPKFDKQYILSFFCSMIIGNLINFGFYGTIAIIATLIFNKNTIILFNVILNVILFIWQTITLFAIKIPILQALDNNIYPETISIIQRKKDEKNEFTSEYEVKQMVRFEIQASKEKISDFIKKATNEEIKNYWQAQQDNDLNRKLNVIDIGSQLTITYDSFGLQKLLDQKAHKTFGISKFHDYNLTSTASPEILSSKESIDWLYVDEKKLNSDELIYKDLICPNVVCFFGDGSSSVTSVIKKLAFVDFSIGTVWSSNSKQTNYVTFPSDKWKQYSDGFDEMYNNIFINCNKLKTKDNADNYFTKSNNLDIDWSNRTNSPKYYELIWYCLAKEPRDIISSDSWHGDKANQKTFEVNALEDLNTRFIQFKHYVYWKLIAEQKDMLLHPTNVELTFIKEQKEQYKSIFDFQLNDEHNETWYVKASPDLAANTSTLFEEGTQTPALFLIKLAKGQTYEKYKRQSLIYKNCVATNELHLFDSIDKFQRSNNHRGQHYVIQQTYVPWIATQESYYGHNLGLFFYESKPRFDFSACCLVWSLISLALYTIGFVAYQRYDIK